MYLRSISIFAAIVVMVGTICAPVEARGVQRHHHRIVRHLIYSERIAPPVPFQGGRLVFHPANNIACMTRDVATRALPCDQPVWVYGEPCEIDLGLGRSRSCD